MITADDLKVSGEVFIEKDYESAIKSVLERGLKPSRVKDVVSFRLESLERENEDLWWETPFCTCDGIASYGRDKIKVIKDSKNIRELKPIAELKSRYIMGMRCYCVSSPNRVLMISKEEYKKLEGEEFSISEFESKYGLSSNISKEDIKKCPLWIELIEDLNMLENHIESTFRVHSDRSLPMRHNLLKISLKRGLVDNGAVIYPIYINSISGLYATDIDSQVILLGLK